MKVKETTIVSFILILLNIPLPYISQRSMNIVALILSLIQIFLLSLWDGKNAIKNNRSIFWYSLVTMLCTCITCGLSTRTLTSFTYSLKYFVVFWTISHFYSEHKMKKMFVSLYHGLFIILMLTDFVVLITNGTGIGGNSVLPLYVIGNKFVVSYYHFLFLSLFLIVKNLDRIVNIILFIFFWILSFLIILKVNCSTGVVGCLLFLVLFFLKNTPVKNIVNNWKSYVVLLIGGTLLLTTTDVLLTNPLFKNLVENILHRNMTLTGRLDMFQITLNAIKQSPVCGYGINSTIVQDALTWGNAQNGILKIVLDFGIVGLGVLLVLIYDCYKNADKTSTSSYAICMFLFVMGICSMVEINLSGVFILGLALLKYSCQDLNIM